MNHVFNLIEKSKNKIQLCVLVISAFFVSSIAFAQESRFEISPDVTSINKNVNIADTTPDNVSASVSVSASNSNMNFILWFMGTKEDVNGIISNDSFYSKKSILTSGREPNHLLLKTLLKKAINIKSC